MSNPSNSVGIVNDAFEWIKRRSRWRGWIEPATLRHGKLEGCLCRIDLRWWRAMKLGLLSVLVLGVAVSAAGCGGGKKAASSTSVSAATTTSARATTTESKKAVAP